MYSTKFNDHKNAQAQINHYRDGRTTLQSYNTELIEVKDNWIRVLILWDSNTSRRHMGWFAKLYNLDYQTLKSLALNNYKMNVETGEVMAIA